MSKAEASLPLENPKLISAIKELKEHGDPEAENAFAACLPGARFLAPVLLDPPPNDGLSGGKVTLKEDTRVSFILLSLSEGDCFFPAFTSWEELRKWRREPGVRALITTFEDYLSMILPKTDGASGFVIDPFGENLLLRRELMLRLRDKSDKLPKAGEQVTLGQPKEFPVELAQALKKALKTQRQAHRAFLQLMVRGTAQSYLLVLDHPENTDCQAIYDALAEAAKPYLKELPLDIVCLRDELGQKATEGREPFYVRRRFGLF